MAEQPPCRFGCWYDQNGGPQPLYCPWQGECIPKGSSHLLGLTKCVSAAPSQAPLLCREGCTAPRTAGGYWSPCREPPQQPFLPQLPILGRWRITEPSHLQAATPNSTSGGPLCTLSPAH